MKDEFKPVKPEKFKKYKKGQLGSWQKFNTKTDAGNVELNTQFFNNASTPQASPNTSPVGGGLGESVEDNNASKHGKPFNVYKQSPFKNSVVKSVVYHGARDLRYDLNYKYAREGTSIRGLYFTTDKSWAEHHGETDVYYINITHPLYIPYKRPSQCNVLDDVYDILLKNGISISKDAFYKRWNTDNLFMSGPMVTLILTYYAVGADQAYSYNKSGSVASKLIQNAGYDGVITTTANDTSEITYIVFSRNQVVRADIDSLTESVEDDYGRYNEVIKALKNTSDDELADKFATGIVDGPMFILSNGKVVGAKDITYDDVHTNIIMTILGGVAGDAYYDLNNQGEAVAIALEYLMDERGWIRTNTGSNSTGYGDDRFYIVLPKKRPTNAQFDSLEEFLQHGNDKGVDEVIVFIETSAVKPVSKVYSYADYFVEDIIKNIKRYYASGVLYEETKLEEVYPNKGESKKDFIARFMKATKNEYPDISQRYAVANSYWEKGLKEDTKIGRYNHQISRELLEKVRGICQRKSKLAPQGSFILEDIAGYSSVLCEYNTKLNTLMLVSAENPDHCLFEGKANLKSGQTGPYSPENLARIFKAELKKFVELRKEINAQYQDYLYKISGRTDGATDLACNTEYSNRTKKSDKILADIREQLPANENIDMKAVVRAYRRLEKRGTLDEEPIPLPGKRVIDLSIRDQGLSHVDWNTKVGENFILYPSRERYEVTHSVEGDPNVICTNLDTQETETFNKGELTQLFHQNKVKFI